MGRRIIRVPIHIDLWKSYVIEGKSHPPIKCTDGLPEDAEYISSYFDGSRHCAYLIFGHESFEEIGDVDPIPEFVPSFTQYYPKNWAELELAEIT